jgi:acetylornithine deacetylase ArgE
MRSTAQLLADLVRLPSVNPMGRDLPADMVNEERVTSYLEEYFRGLDLPCERQEVAPQRTNLVARLDRGAKQTLLLEVHQDTVPVDGMTIDPFGGRVENGRLYGRGACDVKGGMVAMLQALTRLAKEKPRSANIVLACSVDEEHTSLGVRELARRRIQADCAVVAEPTRLNIVHAHKGVARWTIQTPGRSCHSSRPEQGVNAIYRMGRLLGAIERFAERLNQEKKDALLGPATLSVGRVLGGTSVNTVPDGCLIDIDRRLLPGEGADQAPRDLDAFLKTVGFDFDWQTSATYVHMPALGAAGKEQLIERLGNAIRPTKPDFTVHPVPFGTDAPWIAGLGIPTVIFGPGDIAQAHTCDEWIELDEIDQAAEILYRLALALASID